MDTAAKLWWCVREEVRGGRGTCGAGEKGKCTPEGGVCVRGGMRGHACVHMYIQTQYTHTTPVIQIKRLPDGYQRQNSSVYHVPLTATEDSLSHTIRACLRCLHTFSTIHHTHRQTQRTFITLFNGQVGTAVQWNVNMVYLYDLTGETAMYSTHVFVYL